MRSKGILGSVLVLATSLAASAAPGAGGDRRTAAGDSLAATRTAAHRALSFEENVGQFDARARFVARDGAAAVFLARSEVVFAIGDPGAVPATRAALVRSPEALAPPATPVSVVRMRFEGANPAPSVEGVGELVGKKNYLRGADPSRWRTGVRSFADVRYADLYEGVDAVFYGRDGVLEYDLVVAPGADPSGIGLRFEGADRIEVDATGALVLYTARGPLRHEAPVAYQPVAGATRRVAARYEVRDGDSVGFALGAYDAASPLVIDPVLGYSGYVGGSNRDNGQAIAVDGSALYVAGYTLSADFPTDDPIQPYKGGFDVFVAKLDAATLAPEYATYVGGARTDSALAIAVHGGAPVVAGYTNSTDFPVRAPIQAEGRSFDAFALKLTPAGDGLAYSTYLGGSGDDFAFGLAVDQAGSAYLTGRTFSSDYPTRNAFQTAQASPDGFVTKLEADGSAIVYSTYLGGEGVDHCIGGIAVDAAGCAYVAGSTNSIHFPVQTPIDDYFGLGNDVFVTKLSASGSSLVYSTYLGGEADEDALGIAVSATGAAYVVGSTLSVLFPPTGGAKAAGPRHGDESDVFALQIAPDGRSLVYARDVRTLIDEIAHAAAVDAAGNLYVVGFCTSPEFPTLAPVQSPRNSGLDAFTMVFDPTGASYVYSTKLGGAGSEAANAVALGPGGEVFVTGSTNSVDFPVDATAPTSLRGVENAFVVRIAPGPGPVPPAVDKVKAAGKGKSFKLTLTGTGFQSGAQVFIGNDATAWSGATVKGTKVKLKGGTTLEARFPTGSTVRVRVINPDGGAAFTSVRR
jgi:hypothetical protein